MTAGSLRVLTRSANRARLHRRRLAELVAFVVAGLLLALASGELSLVISR